MGVSGRSGAEGVSWRAFRPPAVVNQKKLRERKLTRSRTMVPRLDKDLGGADLQQGWWQGLRINVHTVFTHTVLTLLPGAVQTFEHLSQELFQTVFEHLSQKLFKTLVQLFEHLSQYVSR